MQCDEFEILWQQQLDDRQDPQADVQLRAHASVCGSCQELLDFYQPLVEGLQAGVETYFQQSGLADGPFAGDTQSDDFVARVMRRVTETELAHPTATHPTVIPPATVLPSASLAEPPFRFSPARQAGWLAITAVLLLAGFVITQSSGLNEKGGPVAAPLTQIDSSHAEDQPQRDFAQQSLAEDAIAAESIPEIIAASPQSELGVSPPEIPVSAPDPLSPSELADVTPTSIADSAFESGYPSVVETLQYVTDRLPGVSPSAAAESTRTVWLEEVTGGLKPLAGSVSGAWNALKQTLPMRKEPSIEKPQAGRSLLQSTEAWS